MSGDAIRFHFDSFAKGVIAENNKSPGNPISAVHTDSWESGIHTWSNHFQEEFEKRRGYSMTPWLPVLATGRIVGSAEESDRFLWDLRRTMADLIRDNYYGEMQRLSHASGVLYQSESAGRQSFLYDPVNYFSKVDIPMGEFWTESDEAEEVRFVYSRNPKASEKFPFDTPYGFIKTKFLFEGGEVRGRTDPHRIERFEKTFVRRVTRPKDCCS